MAQNFMQAYDALDSATIMGIYGSAHTDINSLDFSGTIPWMANQLMNHYGDIIYSEKLS